VDFRTFATAALIPMRIPANGGQEFQRNVITDSSMS